MALLPRLADEQILAFGGGDLGSDRTLRHRPAAESANGDLGADREGLPGPSRALERQRAGHLEVPGLDGSVRVLHVDVEVGVRIGPLDLRHDTLHRDRLAAIIVGGPRMVCRKRRRQTQGEAGAQNPKLDLHCHSFTGDVLPEYAGRSARTRVVAAGKVGLDGSFYISAGSSVRPTPDDPSGA